MELKQKVNKPTTHNRVFIETSNKANQLAKKWNCSKIELYRYLVDRALENGGMIEALAQGQLIVSRKDTK